MDHRKERTLLAFALCLAAFLVPRPGQSQNTEESASANSAVVPVPKLENDFYDWYQRHDDLLRLKKGFDPEIVLIGDSITHLWGGEPGSPQHLPNGAAAFQKTFGGRRVLNMGFGWDRTQNVLWRLDHGEFDGIRPAFVVLNIGTNNLTGTDHARENTPSEITEGVKTILLRLRAKSPATQFILMGVFPRGEGPSDPIRAKIVELNRLLAKLGRDFGVPFLDLGPKFLEPDGTLSRINFPDFVHPSESGYAIWGEALKAVMKP